MKKFPCIVNSAPSNRSPVGWRSTALVLAVLSIFALAGSTFAQEDEDAVTVPKTVLSFSTMIGDPGSGPRNVIRGYKGPPAPWVIHSVQGILKTDGSLTVMVQGLVLTNNMNPVPFFRAAVSCQDPADSNKGLLFLHQDICGRYFWQFEHCRKTKPPVRMRGADRSDYVAVRSRQSRWILVCGYGPVTHVEDNE